MANPQTLTADTVLYCAAEPEGRMFPKGEQWPGDAWSATRGGKPVGEASVTQAMKDLIAAQDQIESLSAQLDRQTHSLAERTAERDEAAGKVEALEQRAAAAETAQKAAEEAARGYMTERDAARADAKRFSDAADGLRPQAESAAALVEQLNAANQTIADLKGQLDAATAKKAPKKADAAPQDGAEAAPDA